MIFLVIYMCFLTSIGIVKYVGCVLYCFQHKDYIDSKRILNNETKLLISSTQFIC